MAEAGTLHDAFLDELRDAYDAEKQLIKALPKMAKAATSTELRAALRVAPRGDPRTVRPARTGLRERSTRRCAASTATASPASSKKASRSWKRTSTTTTMDACLIASGQRVEHYEMAAYGTLLEGVVRPGR